MIPPNGALKAAAIPAAAPIEIHARSAPGERFSSMDERIEAMHAPRWTRGPSRPRGSEEETTRARAIDFAMSTFEVRYPVMSAPLRLDLMRAMPEALAWGSHLEWKRAPIEARA